VHRIGLDGMQRYVSAGTEAESYPRTGRVPRAHRPRFTLHVYAHLMPTASERMRKAVDGMLSGEVDGPAPAHDGA